MAIADWIKTLTGRKLSATKMRYAREGKIIPGRTVTKHYKMEGDKPVVARDGEFERFGVHCWMRTRLVYTPEGFLERFDDYFRSTSRAGTEIKDITTTYNPPGTMNGEVVDKSWRY